MTFEIPQSLSSRKGILHAQQRSCSVQVELLAGTRVEYKYVILEEQVSLHKASPPQLPRKAIAKQNH